MKDLGDVDGLLSQRAVRHEEHLVRLRRVAEAPDLVDEPLVNLEPACGVEQDGVGSRRHGRVQAGPADRRDVP